MTNNLSELDRRISEAEAAIGRQCAVVARLRMMGRDAREAEETLKAFIVTRNAFVSSRDAPK